MPCTGPGINEAELDKAYKEIMLLLCEKYTIQKWAPFFDKENNFIRRNLLNIKFKEVLRDLFLQEECENF